MPGLKNEKMDGWMERYVLALSDEREKLDHLFYLVHIVLEGALKWVD